eukprot:TRINITY_DN867_c0_g1_i7.p1 TRINITY_DN867_c0_g1~~TRINITY_DN867_c0_g1_i7.p1  ORF type:complete len:875 (-),score=249.13 TRINITY_DN867_c0_g1_i7:576-3200(-)
MEGENQYKGLSFNFEFVCENQPDAELDGHGIRFNWIDGSDVATEMLQAWIQDELEESEEGASKPQTRRWKKEFAFDKGLSKDQIIKINEDPHVLLSLFSAENPLMCLIPIDFSQFFISGQHSFSTILNEKTPFCVLPTGVASIALNLKLNKDMLSEEQMDQFNPLAISIGRVKRLPGISGQKGFDIQREYCEPFYVSFNWLSNEFLPENRSNGVVRSLWGQANSNHDANVHCAFLMGEVNANHFREFVETTPLVVEIHDRDRLDGSWKEQTEKWASDIGERTLFELAKNIYQELKQKALKAGDSNAHGTATFRMERVLRRDDEQVRLLQRRRRESQGNKEDGELPEDEPISMTRIKQTVDIVPQKRRLLPQGGLNFLDLSKEDVLISRPGDYLHNNSTIALTSHLHRTLESEILPTDDVPLAVFGRMVFYFPYNNKTFLQKILAVMAEINSAAVPGVSLQSHQFEDEQMDQVISGELDVVCGFMVIDDKSRLIVVEGLREKGLQLMVERLQDQPNTPTFKILHNQSVSFTKRLYAEYHTDLRKVRLRHPLQELVESPDIYNRAKVSAPCFYCLTKLNEIKSAERLIQLKRGQLWPEPDQLQNVERIFGEAITLQDIDGRVKERRRRSLGNKGNEDNTPVAVQHDNSASATTNNNNNTMSQTRKTVRTRRKASTVHQNPNFENLIQTRQPRDYVKERHVEFEEVQAENMRKSMQKKEEIARELEALGIQDVTQMHVYSGQTLNLSDRQREDMRHKLAKQKGATFTYSKQFQSLAVPLVTEEDVKKKDIKEREDKFMTKRGFVYPAPRKPKEFYKHPMAPSASRVEQLAEQWVENELQPKPLERGLSQVSNKPSFVAVPSSSGNVFGYVDAKGVKN